MKTFARRGAVLAALAAAIGSLTLSPAAAEDTTTTVAASAFRQASRDPFTGVWAGTGADAPWPATSTSTGTAYSGRAGMGGIYGWLVEFPLPSRMTCKSASATVSLQAVRQIIYGPGGTDDAPAFADSNVALYPGSGRPTANQFDTPAIENRWVTPEHGSPLVHDVSETVRTLVSQGSGFVGVRLTGMSGVTLWDAPMDQPATRPALSVTCSPVGPDDDHDGVANADDICAKTVLPDKIGSLSKVKYAANSSGVFRSGAGATPGISLDHTAGCSAIQIGQRLGPVVELDVRLWGLSLDKLQKWAATH